MSDTVPSPTIRVLSYNVRYFGHRLRGLASTRAPMRAIARAVARLDPTPDIVCLQEIETISLRSRLAYGRVPATETQLESFMGELGHAFALGGRHLPYEAFYFRAHVNRVRDIPIYTTGLAILVDVTRLQVEAHNVAAPEKITHHHIELWKDRKQTRICAHMRVSVPDGPRLDVFNTHLSLPTPFTRSFWKRDPRGRMGCGPNQIHEARTLAAFVHRHAAHGPFILCGDFNSAPGSPVFRYLTNDAGFVSAQVALGTCDPSHPRAFPTAGFMRLRMHLDHLFSGGGVTWVDLEGTSPFGSRSSPFAGLSDHSPLIARLKC